MKDQNFFDGDLSSDVEIIPLEYKVIVEVEQIEDLSAGGIFLPDAAREKQQFAIDRGTLKSLATNAFADGSIFGDQRPKPGDKIMYAKYAGAIFHTGKGNARRLFRIMNDKDVIAILKPVTKAGENE